MQKTIPFKLKTLIGGLVFGAALSTDLNAVPSNPDFLPDFEIVVSDGQHSDTVTLKDLEKLEKKLEKKLENVDKDGQQWDKHTIKLLEKFEFQHGLGSIEGLELVFNEDPIISLGFVVTAGGAPTVFTISSAILPVGLVGPTGAASASVTLTDSTGNGATLTGGYGVNAYRAIYNTGVPSVFALLDPSFAVGAFGSTTVSGAAGPAVIPGLVADMQSSYKFTLSANDSASGTSVYVITPRVPETGSALILAAFSGLALAGIRLGTRQTA